MIADFVMDFAMWFLRLDVRVNGRRRADPRGDAYLLKP